MAHKSARELWQEYCELVPGIRAQFGLPSAMGYLVGGKLMAFAQIAAMDSEYRAELPEFCSSVRKLFTEQELEQHFAFVDKESSFEDGLLTDVPPEDMERHKELWRDLIEARERRARLKALLLPGE